MEKKISQIGAALLVFVCIQLACVRGVAVKPTPTEAPAALKTATPRPTFTPLSKTPVNCNVSQNAYAWSYQGFQQSSGTGGIACNATFVLKNNYASPVRLIVKTDFDNNAMKWEKWNTISIKPGEEWSYRVNRTNYKSGVVTHSAVLKLLVFRDAPECTSLFKEDKQPFWEIDGMELTPFNCN